MDCDLPLNYEGQIGTGSPQIWMWISGAVEEIIPVEASYRRFLLLTAAFTDSDTVIDGAGKIGFAVEENKDTLALEARDEDSIEALVLSDSANFLA